MRFFNRSVFLALSCFLAWSEAKGAEARVELTTLLGTPNSQQEYVREILRKEISLAPGRNFVDFTTGVLYFAWRNGALSAQAIQILGEGGNAHLSDALSAIDSASASSSVVLAPLVGDRVEEMCARMAEKNDTVFLVTLGEAGYTLSPFFTKCASRNILFVTTLNAELTALGEFASYGPLVRLAVPGVDLSAPVEGDRYVSFLSDGFGMGIAAGKLAAFLRSNPELRGAGLLEAFLTAQEVLPSLRGKVTGARALRRFEK